MPPEATHAAQALAAPERLVLTAAGGLGTITGTLPGERLDRAVRVAPTTLVITLSRDTWVHALEFPPESPALAALLLASIVSSRTAEEEPTGWEAVVRPALLPSMLTRLGNATMQLTIPALPGYQLSGPSETLVVRLPPALVSSDQPVAVEPPIEIVRSESIALSITLVRDSFVREVGTDSAASTALLHGLTSPQNEPHGWNAIIGTRLRYPDLQMLDERTALVHVPQFHDYQIVLPESVVLTLPTAATASRTSFVATPELVLYPYEGIASLGGGLSLGTSEAALVVAEHVLLISLDGNEYVTNFLDAPTDPERLSISRDVLSGLAGRLSAAASPEGWNGRLLTLDPLACVTRLSSTQLEVRLPALPGFAVTAPELVTVTLPATALAGRQPVLAGTYEILADPGVAMLSGPLLTANLERTIQTAHSQIVVTLRGDEFEDALGADANLAAELLASIGASGGETSFGFLPEVRDAAPLFGGPLDEGSLRLLSSTQLSLTIPQRPRYSIITPETVVVTLPGSVLRSRRTIAPLVPLVLRADRGTLSIQLTDTFGAVVGYSTAEGLSVNDDQLKEVTTELRLMLSGDAWSADLGSTNSTGYKDLVDRLITDQPPSLLTGWRNFIHPQIDPANPEASPTAVQRIDSQTLLITIPATAPYVFGARPRPVPSPSRIRPGPPAPALSHSQVHALDGRDHLRLHPRERDRLRARLLRRGPLHHPRDVVRGDGRADAAPRRGGDARREAAGRAQGDHDHARHGAGPLLEHGAAGAC